MLDKIGWRWQKPVTRVSQRDEAALERSITPDGRLLMMIQNVAFNGITVVGFLKHVLCYIQGNPLIIWDGLPAHRGQAVKDFLRLGAARRIHLEGYAPDLNPDEGIWRYLKQVEMKNLCCHSLDELHYELHKAAARLRHKTDVILACFKQAHVHVQV